MLVPQGAEPNEALSVTQGARTLTWTDPASWGGEIATHAPRVLPAQSGEVEPGSQRANAVGTPPTQTSLSATGGAESPPVLGLKKASSRRAPPADDRTGRLKKPISGRAGTNTSLWITLPQAWMLRAATPSARVPM